MRSLTRGGFTLIELLVAMVMLSILAGSLVAIVRSAGAAATRSAARLLADRVTITLDFLLREELRDAAVSDVQVISSSRVALSRPIGEGTPCQDSAGVVLLPDASWNGTRAAEAARDEVLLLVDAAAGTWQRVSVDSVGRSRCPIDHRSAALLHVAPHPGHALDVRIVEPVELSAYRSGPADWFGLTPANHSSAVQPFAGPLVLAGTRFSVASGVLVVSELPLNAAAVLVQTPLRAVP